MTMMAGGATFVKCLFSIAFLLCAFMAVPSQAEAIPRSRTTFITVDQSGNGDYTRIQDAVDAVPSNNAQLVFIWVKPGLYKEKVAVPPDKPFLTISGTGTAHETVIAWKECGEINQTAVFSVLATDFIGRFLTIQNTYGVGNKSVALRVSADRAAFYACRILSHQDALFDDIGRHYYRNCYIEGDTDFIFGSAASFFHRCHIHSVSDQNGAITAQRRNSSSKEAGFTFVACKITGVKTAVLGRPWGPYSTVIFAYTHMSDVVLPRGWDSWGHSPSYLSTVYYGQYKCYGPGAATSQRVKWVHDLTRDEVMPLFSQASKLRFGSWQGRRPLLRPNGVGENNLESAVEAEQEAEAPSPVGEDVGVGWDAVELREIGFLSDIEYSGGTDFSSGSGSSRSSGILHLLLSFCLIIFSEP